MRVAEGDSVAAEGVTLRTIYTPGHTDDSCSFALDDRVFTGDTLLIRGTGRTDFQNGDPRAQYDSIFNKLLKLPQETLVYPAHDYKGETVSTIGEEKSCNPRLQVSTVEEYVELMDNLCLPNPRMMDVAVPANQRIGLSQDELARRGWAYQVGEISGQDQLPAVVLVDLRDDAERQKSGVIAGSVHAPYLQLDDNVRAGGILHELAKTTEKEIVFYCAYGERSAMAVQIAREAGLDNIRHIHGGIAAWSKANLPLTRSGT
jgi:rhodanese-related sulfurtransferase